MFFGNYMTGSPELFDKPGQPDVHEQLDMLGLRAFDAKRNYGAPLVLGHGVLTLITAQIRPIRLAAIVRPQEGGLFVAQLCNEAPGDVVINYDGISDPRIETGNVRDPYQIMAMGLHAGLVTDAETDPVFNPGSDAARAMHELLRHSAGFGDPGMQAALELVASC
jgi:hypothetical protein